MGDAAASLGSAITSPAKLAFAAYIIVVTVKPDVLNASVCQFFLVVALFLVIQIFHDDFLRAYLNRAAELKAEISRASALRNGKLQIPESFIQRLAVIEDRLKSTDAGR
jgi:hypothetical protein